MSLLFSSLVGATPRDIAFKTIEAFEYRYSGWLHEKQSKDIEEIAAILISYVGDPTGYHLRKIHADYLKDPSTDRHIAAIQHAFEIIGDFDEDGEDIWLDVFSFVKLTREQVKDRGLAKNKCYRICGAKDNKKVLKRIAKLLDADIARKHKV